MSELFLGLLQTAGNQAYIFSTNRLRENVGASQRVWEAGVKFTCRAAAAVTDCPDFEALGESAQNGSKSYVRAMADAPRLDGGAAIEIVVATSGKALFLARTRADAEQLISFATRMALEEAPGLSLRGVVAPIAGHDARVANGAVHAVHQKMETIRDRLPPPEIRFPTLPILEPCRSSGLPATEVPDVSTYGPDPGPASAVTLAKCRARKEGERRIARLIGRSADEMAQTVEHLKKKTDWVGIVHADGNGVGQLFLEFGEICGETTLHGYFDAYRKFSLSLDLCGVAAFCEALEEIYPAPKPGERIPLIPLILGGDDLTVLGDGRMAVRFAAAYLKAFQEQTIQSEVFGEPSLIPTILGRRNERDSDSRTRLGAAAGIAVTKPHYPFHRGYELAERLLKQAKTAKTEIGVSRCALDFHVLFDGAETSLDDLRERWTLRGGYSLTARPYVLGDDDNEDDGAEEGLWARNRRWQDLQDAAQLLRGAGRDGDNANLPRSQQYALRAALFRGRDAADRQLALIRHRYGCFRWRTVVYEDKTSGGPPSLFFPIDDHGTFACRLLDAMELADLARK